MKNNPTKEIILSILLLTTAALFCNPLQKLWMPTMFASAILLCFLIIFILFAAFIWKEKPRDEREEANRLLAGRVGFLAGTGILVIGIIYQTLKHNLDIWLLVTLLIMILAKLIVGIYSEKCR